MQFVSIRHNMFCRLIINEEFIDFMIFKLNIIIERTQITVSDISKLAEKLKFHRLPIEIIINNVSMICRQLTDHGLNKNEIVNLHKNILKSKASNTVMLYAFKQQLIHNIVFVECELSGELCKIIQVILDLKLKILNFAAFPCWVIRSLELNSQLDLTTFSTQIIAVNYNDYCHIIVLNNNKILCNRICDIHRLDLQSEIKNTLLHIKVTFNIPLSEVVIYEYDQNIFDQLWRYNDIKMQITSRIFQFNNHNTELLANKLTKAMGIIAITGFGLSGVRDCIELKNLEDDIENKIHFLNNNKINDIKIWLQLHTMHSINQPDYFEAILKYSKERKNKFRNIYMKLTNDQISCSETKNI